MLAGPNHPKEPPISEGGVSREEAQKRIEVLNEPYKFEILERIKEEPITIYHIGKCYCLLFFSSCY
jgi:threonyl-tRNA synthetase